jgi:hypothetical protein
MTHTQEHKLSIEIIPDEAQTLIVDKDYVKYGQRKMEILSKELKESMRMMFCKI